MDTTAADAAAKTRGSKKRRRAIVRWAIYGALGAGVLALVVVASMPKPLRVEVQRVTRGPFEVTVDEDGVTRLKDRYVVSAPLSGMVDRLGLDAGDEVAEGAVLARIQPLEAPLLGSRAKSEMQARLAAAQASYRQSLATSERAKAALAFAKQEAERQRKLGERGIASQQVLAQHDLDVRSRQEELASADFGGRVASHQVRMARAVLGRTPAEEGEQFAVTAPIRGRVLRVAQESAGVVQAGAPLVELGDPKAIEIVVDVLTNDAVRIHPGNRVYIDRWGGDSVLAGHVRLVEPSGFSKQSALGVAEQRVNVIVDLDEPLERYQALGDGYRIEARIVVFSAAEALQIPSSAVFRHEGGWATFAIADERAVLTKLKIGRRAGLRLEVLGGLTAGTPVIDHPSDRIAHGVRITAR